MSDIPRRLDEDGVSTTDVIDNRGVQQKTNVVTEAGLYEVIIRSDKPEAKAFRRWVTSEVLFVLKDVCNALGITNTRNVSARLDEDMKGVRPVDTLGGTQQLTVINEVGLYEVIIRKHGH